MGSSSFLNAFRLIKKKPVLLLLLLPLQLAMPLVAQLMPLSSPSLVGDMSDPTVALNSMLGVYASLFGMLGFILLLYIVAGIFLIPPAMELLHDGAQDSETSPGWYGRAMGKHWWKPVSIGAIEVVITLIFAIIFYIVLVIILLASAPQIMNLTQMQSINQSDLLSQLSSAAIPALILGVVFILVCYLLLSFFAMLMAATADRSFGDAFRVLFSGFGFKKVMKVFGVYLLAKVVSGLIVALFGVGYMLLSRRISSADDMLNSYVSFAGSWTYYFATVLASFIILFKYGYIFSVFQEIKRREAPAKAAELAAIGSAQEGEGL